LLGESGSAGKPLAMVKADGVDPEVAAKERKLEQILLGQPLNERTRAAVIGQSTDSTAAIQAAKEFQAQELGEGGASGAVAQRNTVPDDRQAAIMAGLLLGSPDFQRR
jgi:hypothetical protein